MYLFGVYVRYSWECAYYIYQYVSVESGSKLSTGLAELFTSEASQAELNYTALLFN